MRTKQKEILFGLKRKSLRASEERQRNMQLFIPSKMNFSVDVSTSLVPPIADASKDDSLEQMSHSVLMQRSVTQPDTIIIDRNMDLKTQKMALTFDSALLTRQVPQQQFDRAVSQIQKQSRRLDHIQSVKKRNV